MLEESRGWRRCLSLSGHRVSFFPPLEQPQTCCLMKGHLLPPECVCMQTHTPHTCVLHMHESQFLEVIGLSWANLPSPQQKPGHSIFFFFTLLAAHLHARRRLLYDCRQFHSWTLEKILPNPTSWFLSFYFCNVTGGCTIKRPSWNDWKDPPRGRRGRHT